MHKPITATHHDRHVERRASDRHEHASAHRFQRVLSRLDSPEAASARDNPSSASAHADKTAGEEVPVAGGIDELMALLSAMPGATPGEGEGTAVVTPVADGAAEGNSAVIEGVRVPEAAAAIAPQATKAAGPSAEISTTPPTPTSPAPPMVEGLPRAAAGEAPPSMVLPSTAKLAGLGALDTAEALATATPPEPGKAGAAPSPAPVGPAASLPASGASSQPHGASAPAGAAHGPAAVTASSANPLFHHGGPVVSVSPFAESDASSPNGTQAAALHPTVTADGTVPDVVPDARADPEHGDIEDKSASELHGETIRASEDEPIASARPAAGGDAGGDASSRQSSAQDRAPGHAPRETAGADASLRARFVEAQAQAPRQRPGRVEVSVANHPLGALDVILQMQQDGDLSVTVRAATDDALATLQNHAEQLTAAITSPADGGAAIDLSFELSDQGGHAAGHAWNEATAGATAAASSPDVTTTTAFAYATNTRAAIDIRV